MNDLAPFEHGEERTHYVCLERVEKYGDVISCCGCIKHECRRLDKREWEKNLDESVEDWMVRYKVAYRNKKALKELIMSYVKRDEKEIIEMIEEKWDKYVDMDLQPTVGFDWYQNYHGNWSRGYNSAIGLIVRDLKKRI